MASSLEHASSTIDELTQALANFSRLPSPEPLSSLNCCCKREDCENLGAWHALKGRLESRLTLSAEIGQALLHRSGIFSRRHHQAFLNGNSEKNIEEDYASGEESESTDSEFQLLQLTNEKRELERRLTQALVNTEVTEVSNKTILQELQEAKLTISRLSSHRARSVGWETRLSAATRERDDMQQERDFESHRARLAESRFAALKERTSKLQAEVRRLQDELQEKRMHRMESSESIIQEARSQIQMLHQSLGNSFTPDTDDLTQMLESLVDDNEALKRDNVELQTLLAQSRDDTSALQQEVEEQRALNAPRSRAIAPLSPHLRHAHSGSVSSSLQLAPILSRREPSLERKTQRSFEPLTPETVTTPISPAESTFPSRSRQLSPYLVESQDADIEFTSAERPRTHKPLYLLARSRGVQTDPSPVLLAPSPAPTSSYHDLRSESSSSYSESYSSTMSTLVDRIGSLLQRMTEADALTLTNRLKRQHLRGADVGHVSRSTISNIVNEVSGLRAQFRYLLEDEKLVTICTRKDLRAIFKLFRDIFVEMGQIRVTLNDIVLDPSIAPKVSELALDPKKETDKASSETTTGIAGGWIAPISKLFGTPAARVDSQSATPVSGCLMRTPSTKGNARPRFVPKLGPATSASTTTVNVEFSGAVGRAVTSTSLGESSHEDNGTVKKATPALSITPASTNVMGIFAGAPRPSAPDRDPWVVLPKQPRRVQSVIRPAEMLSPANIHRVDGLYANSVSSQGRRLSRNVDAIIDTGQHLAPHLAEDEASDRVAPLLQRTLRRRGLSDSSIHTSFVADQGDTSMNSNTTMLSNVSTSGGSVFQALSKRVQNFRMGVSAMPSSSFKEPSPMTGRRGAVAERELGGRTVPGLSFITSWASSGHVLDPTLEPQRSLLVGSPPRDDLLEGTFGSRRGEDVYY
ncbi:hypothetical protein E1B28_004861 [Marasmius oreades]|uniref:Uncharacterized protein n=1 Tax=Marasmius oreades TaxID=181124 RepID=A0A9P7UZJ9_9AGAR|nr:uncharacterized protein E1B28_004861 [Marasmius oreades]KAG7097518.1 hypothetical protein E1B28_004861 [Marasmius oreades]